MRHNFISVLDIGTTKICCWISRQDEKGQFHIIGAGHQASRGFNSGQVTDMRALEVSISQAVQEAEKASGETIQSVFMSINGGHLESSLINVEVSVLGATVGDEDLSRLLLQARLEKDPESLGTIHTLPLQYTLDGQKGIRDPRGMMGSHLRGCIHVISGALAPLRNILICVERCHLDIAALVSSPYASGLSCLAEDERELGATLVEMGGGSTTIASFWGGNLIHTDFIPIGGNHLTKDLARGIETSVHYGERLKILYGAAIPSENDQREVIPVLQSGEVIQIPRSSLVTIIQPRLKEIFYYIEKKLEKAGFNSLIGQRIVLTGGASQLPGMRDFASGMLKRSVRIGKPICFSGAREGERPEFSTVSGLICYTKTDEFQRMAGFMGHHEKNRRNLWRQITSWLRENL